MVWGKPWEMSALATWWWIQVGPSPLDVSPKNEPQRCAAVFWMTSDLADLHAKFTQLHDMQWMARTHTHNTSNPVLLNRLSGDTAWWCLIKCPLQTEIQRLIDTTWHKDIPRNRLIGNHPLALSKARAKFQGTLRCDVLQQSEAIRAGPQRETLRRSLSVEFFRWAWYWDIICGTSTI